MVDEKILIENLKIYYNLLQDSKLKEANKFMFNFYLEYGIFLSHEINKLFPMNKIDKI